MKIFWADVTAEPAALLGLGLGVGVTAYDEKDASILVENAFPATTIASLREVRSIDDLDQDHVAKNMGVHLQRWIWFPNVGQMTR